MVGLEAVDCCVCVCTCTHLSEGDRMQLRQVATAVEDCLRVVVLQMGSLNQHGFAGK